MYYGVFYLSHVSLLSCHGNMLRVHMHLLPRRRSTDGAGYLHIMTSTNDILSYQGYVVRVQHLYQLKTRNIILSVGDDEDFSPLIRVWNMDKVAVVVVGV